MTGTVSLVSVRCHYCSKWFGHHRVHLLGPSDTPAQTICENCLDWHMKAVSLLGGGEIPGCQQCGATKEKLCAESPDVEMRLYVVPKDGIYQVLCSACIGPYIRLRSDLYRDTPFGARLKL